MNKLTKTQQNDKCLKEHELNTQLIFHAIQ